MSVKQTVNIYCIDWYKTSYNFEGCLLFIIVYVKDMSVKQTVNIYCIDWYKTSYNFEGCLLFVWFKGISEYTCIWNTPKHPPLARLIYFI